MGDKDINVVTLNDFDETQFNTKGTKIRFASQSGYAQFKAQVGSQPNSYTDYYDYIAKRVKTDGVTIQNKFGVLSSMSVKHVYISDTKNKNLDTMEFGTQQETDSIRHSYGIVAFKLVHTTESYAANYPKMVGLPDDAPTSGHFYVNVQFIRPATHDTTITANNGYYHSDVTKQIIQIREIYTGKTVGVWERTLRHAVNTINATAGTHPTFSARSWNSWVKLSNDAFDESAIAFTASNGVKKVGNDFQLNNSENPNNNIKKLDDGSVYAPTTAKILGIRNTTSMTEFINRDDPFIGVNTIVTYTPKAEHIVPTSPTDFKVNVESFISNVRVTYYFKTGDFDGIKGIAGLGHEHIKNISLMPSTIRATSDSLADTNVNSHLFANNLNTRIKDLSYADGKLSFTIPKVYSYLPAEVQLVVELKDSVKSLGASDTIKFTGFVVVDYTSPDSVEGYLLTYKQDINFSLVGNGG